MNSKTNAQLQGDSEHIASSSGSVKAEREWRNVDFFYFLRAWAQVSTPPSTPQEFRRIYLETKKYTLHYTSILNTCKVRIYEGQIYSRFLSDNK